MPLAADRDCPPALYREQLLAEVEAAARIERLRLAIDRSMARYGADHEVTRSLVEDLKVAGGGFEEEPTKPGDWDEATRPGGAP